ncbi:hypothetical protein [Streptomyces sp. NPDC052701]|uniref:hypothetical protein n=1 Tax=Streptomyces sp. NPDC052701 TaxID=3155533 RepID=UPI003446DE22
MKTYCKGYRLGELRTFREWDQLCRGTEAGMADGAVVYLWNDLTVVRTPVLRDEGLLVGEVTQSWREFCETVLGFTVRAESAPSAPMEAAG